MSYSKYDSNANNINIDIMNNNYDNNINKSYSHSNYTNDGDGSNKKIRMMKFSVKIQVSLSSFFPIITMITSTIISSAYLMQWLIFH